MAENESKKTEGASEGAGRQRRPGRSRYGRGRRPQQKPAAQKRAEEPAENKSQAPKQEPRRQEQKNRRPRTERPAARGAEQQAAASRKRSVELLDARQKAFNEATDIMLLEQERRAAQPKAEPAEGGKVEIVGVRFRRTGKIYYFSPGGASFSADDGVIVETARGQEYGYVALANRLVDEKETVQPLKPVLRKATEADTAKNELNRQLEQKAASVWESLVAKHKLSMKLTDIEYTFDNTKLIFYFTAEGRVDFRELVKDLAAVFRTRIELRQIGVRDEAKLIGGVGVCGMPFCCRRFLPDFAQVSIKMAKEQNLSLSSSKISGNCGRLMCCLRYEQDVYEKEYETFPRADMVVRTAQGTGVITESSFLTGKIKVQIDGEEGVTRTYTRDEVKVIGEAKASKEQEPVDKELKELED